MINWHRIKKNFINYLTIHLFLNIISLPIIIAWGLPFSWLSPIGNFLFTPLLSIFLFFSSLIFFSELFGIPHAALRWLLEWVGSWWQWLLALAPSYTLYGFYTPSWWILGTIAIIALLSLMHPLMQNPMRRLVTLSCSLLLIMIVLHTQRPTSFIRTVACNKGSVTIIRTHNQTIVIDPGYIGSRISAPSWISYSLMPELIAMTGSLTIDHLILLKLNTCTCNAIDALLHDAQIKHLYMPYVPTLDGSFALAFHRLYAHAKQTNVVLSRLTSSPITISPDKNASFSINASQASCKKNHFMVKAKVNHETIEINGT